MQKRVVRISGPPFFYNCILVSLPWGYDSKLFEIKVNLQCLNESLY